MASLIQWTWVCASSRRCLRSLKDKEAWRCRSPCGCRVGHNWATEQEQWNIKKCYWWTYLQGRNKDADIENGLVDTVQGGAGGTNWESSTETHRLPCLKQMASGNCWITQRAQPRGVGWGRGWEEGLRERGCVYTYDWFMLLYDRSQYNIIKQLSCN